jgi:hypothetical protein
MLFVKGQEFLIGSRALVVIRALAKRFHIIIKAGWQIVGCKVDRRLHEEVGARPRATIGAQNLIEFHSCERTLKSEPVFVSADHRAVTQKDLLAWPCDAFLQFKNVTYFGAYHFSFL